MSGSSSSGRSFSGGGQGFSRTSSINCSDLSRRTIVISPTMVFFSSSSIRDKLKIELDQDEVVVLINDRNDQVGSINPTWITELIDCLKQGKKFEAIILKIDGALIEVNIKSI